ncbi:MAG: hypothetical protein H6559_36005 [Lewinellaceae bacterium]|nr:hypothetical protein [Lewinellaceae bacterium]
MRKYHDAEQLLEEEKARLNFQQALMDFAQNTATYLLPALVVRPVGEPGKRL